MTRTRSQYLLSPLSLDQHPPDLATRRVLETDRAELAGLMLDAYRGTIDDEDEDINDALDAIDHYFELIVQQHSFVVVSDDQIVAMAFVVVVNDIHYVDPIVVATDHKQKGLGQAAVRLLLNALAAHGVTTVGATITDGNIASERLFVSLGFSRRGPWPIEPPDHTLEAGPSAANL